MTELKFMWPVNTNSNSPKFILSPVLDAVVKNLSVTIQQNPRGLSLLLIVWYQCVFVIKLLRISHSRTFTLSSLKWELKGLIAISICLATLQVVTILVATGA